MLRAAGKFALKTTNQVLAFVVGAALLVALVVVLSLGAFRQLGAAAAARTHTYDLIIRADALMSDLVDAETGERGYALTGNAAFLQPYLAVRESIAVHLNGLRSAALIVPAQKHLDAMI